MPGKFEENLRKIGQRVRRLREAKGLHMTIAHDIRAKYKIKLDPSYMSRMELGKVEIPLRTIYALADFLKVSPGTLVDPDMKGDYAGVEYLLADKKLLAALTRLKETLGEKSARRHLNRHIDEVLTIIQNLPPESERKNRAARDDD